MCKWKTFASIGTDTDKCWLSGEEKNTTLKAGVLKSCWSVALTLQQGKGNVKSKKYHNGQNIQQNASQIRHFSRHQD